MLLKIPHWYLDPGPCSFDCDAQCYWSLNHKHPNKERGRTWECIWYGHVACKGTLVTAINSVVRMGGYTLCKNWELNSSCHLNQWKTCVASTRRWNRSLFYQIMACLLFGVKPLPSPMITYSQFDPWQNLVKLKSKWDEWSCHVICTWHLMDHIPLTVMHKIIGRWAINRLMKSGEEHENLYDMAMLRVWVPWSRW